MDWIKTKLFGSGSKLSITSSFRYTDGNRFFHALLNAVNTEHRQSENSDIRHVICLKFRMKLSKLWEKRNDRFSHLIAVCGNYDDYLLHLRNYAEEPTVSDSIFISEALKINIIQIDGDRKRVHWPDTEYMDCVILYWRKGGCQAIFVDDLGIVPLHYFKIIISSTLPL